MKRTLVPNSWRRFRTSLEHLRLDGRVEAGSRLVQDQERRILGERHGDDDALLHATRQLVRIALSTEAGSAIRTFRSISMLLFLASPPFAPPIA